MELKFKAIQDQLENVKGPYLPQQEQLNSSVVMANSMVIRHIQGVSVEARSKAI